MTTISTLPSAPSRADPANFRTRADALLGALGTFVTETNTVAGEVNTNATNAATQASLATTQAGNAATQAGNAATQANNAAISAASAAAAAGATTWVSGTTYVAGNCVFSPVDFQTYRRTIGGAGTTDPSADTTNWAKISAAGGLSVIASERAIRRARQLTFA